MPEERHSDRGTHSDGGTGRSWNDDQALVLVAFDRGRAPGRRARAARNRARAHGTAVTAGTPDTTTEAGPAYTATTSSRSAIGLTDLYLHTRNVVTLVEVRKVTLIQEFSGVGILGLEVVVRHSGLSHCRRGSRGEIALLDGRQQKADQVRLQLCGLRRTYTDEKPHASDTVSTTISPGA